MDYTLSQRILAWFGKELKKPMTLLTHCHSERSRGMCCSWVKSRSIVVVLAMLTVPLIASAQWPEQVIYSFQGGTDGAVPVGNFVFYSAGNLFGVTTSGGSSSCAPVSECGTVYQLTPPARPGDSWTETVLYIFKGNVFGDGATPVGGLVMDAAGNLYGTTAYGGTGDCRLLGTLGGCGTVYEMSPPSEPGGEWIETVLYSFPDATVGYFPSGDLVFDTSGNLYGSTIWGGGEGTNCGNSFYPYCGTVFELSPPRTPGQPWAVQTLYRFRGLRTAEGPVGDGASPNGDLALGNNREIYGTTVLGGFSCPHNQHYGCGTVFKLEPPNQPK